MTIDLIGSEGCTCDDSAFEASVVLYNYGVIYECVAATTGDCLDPAAMSVRARVHHIFLMVSTVLSKIEPDACIGSANQSGTCVDRMVTLRPQVQPKSTSGLSGDKPRR
jgi:hypothetical protein